jgi:hypothetical protein
LSDKEEKEKQEKIIERYNIIKEKIANNIDEQNESLDKPK